MAYAPYVTRDEFKAWTQAPGDAKAPVIDEVLDATSRAIDQHCQRHFWADGTVPDPVARTFAVIDCGKLKFGPFNDLTSISTLATDTNGDGTFETVWSAADYELGRIDRPLGFPYTQIEAVANRRFPAFYGTGRRARVEVTGVWGWPEVPPEVKQACKLKAARLFSRMQSPNGVAGVGDFGPVRISRSDDPDVVMLLDPYRHPATAVFVA